MSIQSLLQQALKAHQQGDLKRALADYKSLLRQSPQHSEALHLLGVCEFQAGHVEAAIAHINTAISLAPKVAQYHNNLGEILRQHGRMGEAEKCYRRALELNPKYADAHNNLALVLQTAGEIDTAAKHLRTALELQPHDPQTAANLGNILRIKGDLQSACYQFRQALKLAPEFSQARLALCELLIDLQHQTDAFDVATAGVDICSADPAAQCAYASAAMALGHNAQARQALHAAVQANPQSVSVQMTLGRLLLVSGDNTEALQCLEQAALQNPAQAQLYALISRACLELNRLNHAHEAICRALDLEPDNYDLQIQSARIHRRRDQPIEAKRLLEAILVADSTNLPATLELAEVYLQTGEPEQAQRCMECALTRLPDNNTIRERLASVLLSAGDFKGCINHLSQIIAEDPERISSYRLLSNAKRFCSKDDSIIDTLTAQLDSRDLTPPVAATGHFSLGKMLADCGRHAQAFNHFTQANRLRRTQLDYDSDTHEALVKEHIHAFNQYRLEQFAEYGNPSRVPIIIAGMPRSGTTLVERILASHPQVSAGGEVDGLTRIYPRSVGGVAGEHYLGLALDSLDARTIERLSNDYLNRLHREHPGARQVTDKTPENFLHLGMAAILFPRTKFIHCFRHPLATCMSNYSNDMALGGAFGYQIDEMAHYYGQYQQIMRHWHALMPERIFELNYEQLVTNFETTCRKLLAFCDLEWDPRCLDFHATKGVVLTASDWQVRQPLYSSAVSNWRHYESQLAPLLQALLDNGVEIPPQTG